MKSLIRHKKIFYSIVALHLFFLFMPVSHAGDIILCLGASDHFSIELKSSDECFSCTKSGRYSQEKDPCFCVDIPISKKAEEPATLLNNGIQPKLQTCLQFDTPQFLIPSYRDALFTFVDTLHVKSITHESLGTIVLLI